MKRLLALLALLPFPAYADVALVRISPPALIQQWPTTPDFFRVPTSGDFVYNQSVGWTDGTFKLVNFNIDSPPTPYHAPAGVATTDVTGNTVTITRNWTPPTLATLKAALKVSLDSKATDRWTLKRGTNSVAVEAALSTGNTNIDAAGTLAAAIAAYQAALGNINAL
jgi:hypothetical protein